MYHRRKHRIARFEHHEQLRVRLDRSRRIVAVQGAPVVQHMHERPVEWKDGKVRPLEPQLLRAVETSQNNVAKTPFTDR
jgi:hypothetical protein